MEFGYDLRTIGLHDCGCCQTINPDRDGGGEVYGCHEKSTVFTRREEEILKDIREVGLKAKDVKKQLTSHEAGGAADEAARKALGEELTRLRRRRFALESERMVAAEERMRLLGHG